MKATNANIATALLTDQAPIDAALVRRLVATRFPHWADLPVTQVKHLQEIDDLLSGHRQAAPVGGSQPDADSND